MFGFGVQCNGGGSEETLSTEAHPELAGKQVGGKARPGGY
jgi:hypothetical protein